MYTAGASLRSENSKSLHVRGSTESPCHFSKSRGSQVGRQRLHKPRTSGFDSRPRNQFSMGCSIIQEVTRLASGRARCKAVAVHHFNASSGHE